jgi:pilus assembly protein CpaE
MGTADEILRARGRRGGTTKIVVAMDSEIDRELVEALTSDESAISVVDYLDFQRDPSVKAGGGDVLVIACSEYTSETGQFVRTALEDHPMRPVVLVCPSSANGYVARAFEDGVDDMLTVPPYADPEQVPIAIRQLAFTIDKALARKRGSTAPVREGLGRMICVLGLKGGSGKTLVAANLGVALASAGHSVAILDLDLQFGDLGLTLGIAPQRTLYDLVRSGGSLDAEKLADFLLVHSSGARVLLSPVRPDQAGMVTPDFLRGVQRLLRETHDYVVIDTPPAFTPEVIAAIDASTDVVMVATRDSLALKNTKLGLETLERMEYDRRHVRLVLNRANTDVGIDSNDLLAILGAEVDVRIPSHRDITLSVNRGEPIALGRRTDSARAFHELAGLYLEDLEAPDRAARARRNKSRRLLFRPHR